MGGGHPPAEPAAPQWLAGGRVGRPHGLDGSFHVTRPRPALLALGAVVRVGGRDAEIVRRAGTDERPILRLGGFEGRAAAEALRGEELLVARTAAPALGADEWYAEDLVGLLVVDAGRSVGTVARLLSLPSCEALEVRRSAGAALLVPLLRDCVRDVDLDARRVDVDLAFLGDTLPGDLALGGDVELANGDDVAGAGDVADVADGDGVAGAGDVGDVADGDGVAGARAVAGRGGPAAGGDRAVRDDPTR